MFAYRVSTGNPERLGVTKTGRDVCFTVTARDAQEVSLLLYRKGEAEPSTELPFTEEMRFADVCMMRIQNFPLRDYEYNYRMDGCVIQDPYADEIRGHTFWGEIPKGEHTLRCAARPESFPWQDDRPLRRASEDSGLYVTHLRGFKMDSSSGVKHPGTFAGIREKIPYLKEMGFTQLELMPVYEFAEVGGTRAGSRHMPLRKRGAALCNYWGYGEAFFFAPKAAYSASDDPVRELKGLVRELHQNGIELILEFSFPEYTSLELATDCIRHWVRDYHIDGIHVTGAAAPIAALALDPLLGRTKIMSDRLPVEHIYEHTYQPRERRLFEYNDNFLVKIRRFLRGDTDVVWQAAECLCRNPVQYDVVNYVAGHNGFTLADMLCFEEKHNEANEEGNLDGTDQNYSCNYGVEGFSEDEELARLRARQARNALLLTILAQGVPAIYGGDEMGNSQQGNNNVYCQDNAISWVQWPQNEEERSLQRFVRDALALRREHPAFGRRHSLVQGTPAISYHGSRAWYGDFDSDSRHIGILYANEEALYVAVNMHEKSLELAIPTAPAGKRWRIVADTGREGDVFLKDSSSPSRQTG
ncbi:MAG: glycogen debranching protein [Lachnospiraceae bacterium]|nr:glycogen debranching protein [Lachnospiraceae bacterium]